MRGLCARLRQQPAWNRQKYAVCCQAPVAVDMIHQNTQNNSNLHILAFCRHSLNALIKSCLTSSLSLATQSCLFYHSLVVTLLISKGNVLNCTCSGTRAACLLRQALLAPACCASSWPDAAESLACYISLSLLSVLCAISAMW